MLACMCGGILESGLLVSAVALSWTGSLFVQWFHHRKCCGQYKSLDSVDEVCMPKYDVNDDCVYCFEHKTVCDEKTTCEDEILWKEICEISENSNYPYIC
jgi:hypothetical protein